MARAINVGADFLITYCIKKGTEGARTAGAGWSEFTTERDVYFTEADRSLWCRTANKKTIKQLRDVYDQTYYNVKIGFELPKIKLSQPWRALLFYISDVEIICKQHPFI